MSRIQKERIRELEAELVKWKAEVFQRGKIIAKLDAELVRLNDALKLTDNYAEVLEKKLKGKT